MFQLKYIEGKNFFSFEHFSIKFTKGMILITGYDDGGKDSNGSGKSTILNAIAFAMFGRTLKGVSGQDVVRWGCTNCKVILIVEGEGHVYEITRSLDKLIFKIDGSSLRGHHRDIQSAIETAFKTNYALFIRSTAFSQGQVEFLAASGDVEKKRIFKEILSLSRLDKAYDMMKDRYDLQFRCAEKLEGELETLAWRKKDLEEKILKAEDAKNSWEEDVKTKTQTLQDKKYKTPPSIEPIQDEIKILQKTLAEFTDLEKDVQTTENKIVYLTMEERQDSGEIDRIWQVIQQGQKVGSRCELCGSIVNKKMLGAHAKELEEQIVNLKKRREEIIREKTDTQDYLKYFYTLKLQRENVSNDIKTAQTKMAMRNMEWSYYTQTCKEIDEQIKEIENGINPYEAYLSDFSRELSAIDGNLSRAKQTFEDTKKLIDSLAFLKFTLSREGAVNHIIEREYASLVSYSNRMLSEISGGRLRLSIRPQRELKSGALKDEIEIMVYVDENKTSYWGLSDGQRQRVNIALLLALNKLCKLKGVNSFDFLLLDEVLDISLAEGGQQDVLTLLKNYQRECSTLILISHQETFKTSFTSHIEVYRDREGISHLRR